jgi:ABC-type multidrug transport system ATPase subunit
MATDIVLHTHNLGKRYKKRWAVKGLNLEVARGEVFGFLGPNGAGKSTTIRMLLSLIRATEGSVDLFGMALRSHRKKVLARVGGLVERADFYLYLSARKNLELIAALMGGLPRRTIDAALDTVGLLHRADDKVKTFSHGMKQRLGIAQAMLNTPELIILDEPTTGLDPQGIKEIRDLITSLSGSMTIFLSSHLLSEIEQVATSMAIINMGELVVQGKVRDLLNAGESTVRIDARPVEQALLVVRAQPYVGTLTEKDGILEAAMSFDRSGVLNRALVEAGLEVRMISPRRSLEEYFLSITAGTSDIR